LVADAVTSGGQDRLINLEIFPGYAGTRPSSGWEQRVINGD